MEIRCLVIKKKWINLILSGSKKLELRGNNTKIRGIIGLIESKSGKIVGFADLKDSTLLNEKSYNFTKNFHRVELDYKDLPYKKTYGWILDPANRLKTPIPYNHPQGAVIWVKINPREMMTDFIKRGKINEAESLINLFNDRDRGSKMLAEVKSSVAAL